MKHLIIIFLLSVLCFSCKEKPKVEYDPDTSYWSVNQFIIDQYNLKVGDPVAITKVVEIDGKTDTTYHPLEEIDWATIFKIFGKADISNPKFYDKYTYNNFDDNFLELSTMTYNAKDPKLFVQREDINYDNISRAIKFIYIETNENSWFFSKQQKLSYYVNDKIIIQETEKAKFSKEKNLMITYILPY
ncbi:MAG TPA: hypothetical protein VLZ83_13835 [Edaphocola sp.]|nr:hypothetical protein [Edaphocola sp.]